MAETIPLSEFRVEKRRAPGTLTLANGEIVHGAFFVAGGSPQHDGPERVGELLNGATHFFPFERNDSGDPRTVLYNRSIIVTVALTTAEARLVPGYDVATKRTVSLQLSTGARITGIAGIYRPEGRDRVSDWTLDPAMFRYVETPEATLLVNVQHILEISELQEGPPAWH